MINVDEYSCNYIISDVIINTLNKIFENAIVLKNIE